MYYCIPRTNVLGGGGGYYGLVVVTPRPPPCPPPRPQALHRSHDNLKIYMKNWVSIVFPCTYFSTVASPDGWAVWGLVMSTRWRLLVDHCVLRNWDRILVRAVKRLISQAGMVSICPLLWQRDVKLKQTNKQMKAARRAGTLRKR